MAVRVKVTNPLYLPYGDLWYQKPRAGTILTRHPKEARTWKTVEGAQRWISKMEGLPGHKVGEVGAVEEVPS